MRTEFQEVTAYAEVEIRSFGGAYEARTKDGMRAALHHTEKGAIAALAGKLPTRCQMTITRIRNR